MKNRFWIATVTTLCAFVIAAAVFVITDDGPPVDAQDSPRTWHVVDMGSWRAEGQVFDGKPVTGRAFIEQLPAECDLVVSPHSDSIFYYACPFDWDPVPD